ncbi:hypothetical protein [Gulosibacter sediminis]|uniref:hypothetical protein n=1 Tax=Gulosibacter sediminis TaxID=1729695 RepID=UPI0024AE43F1|nr:hypothetical protein [Gulosibacter sediminis]
MASEVQEQLKTLREGTLPEVLAWLGPDDAKSWRSHDRTALACALTNRSTADRLEIANALLDRGADAGFVLQEDNVGALHLLFSHWPHDYEPEAVLTARLIEHGADVNLVSPRFGSPLALLAATFKYPDETFQPFYSALIDSSKLDLATVDKGGRSMLENIEKKTRFRQSLYDQLLDYRARTSY